MCSQNWWHTYDSSMLEVNSCHGPDAQHPLPIHISLHPCCHRRAGVGGSPGQGGLGCRAEVQACVCQAQEMVVQGLEQILGTSHLLHCSLGTDVTGVNVSSYLHALSLHVHTPVQTPCMLQG